MSPAEAWSPQDSWQTVAVEGAGAGYRGPFRISGGPDVCCAVPCPQACWWTVAGRGRPWLVGPFQHQGMQAGHRTTSHLCCEDQGAMYWTFRIWVRGACVLPVPVWQTVSSTTFLVLPGVTLSQTSLIKVLLLQGSNDHFLSFLSID